MLKKKREERESVPEALNRVRACVGGGGRRAGGGGG